METIKNAAEVILSYVPGATDPAAQSGKEPGTGETEPGAGGAEPFDPGNKEENEDVPTSTTTATEAPTATSESVALPGEAASLGKPTTSVEDSAPAPAETGAAPSVAAHTSPIAPATAGATADGVTPATGTFLAYPVQTGPTVTDGLQTKPVAAVTTADPAGPRPTTPPKIGSISSSEPTPVAASALPTAATPAASEAPATSTTKAEPATSTASGSTATPTSTAAADTSSGTDSPSGKKKLSTRLKEKLHIK